MRRALTGIVPDELLHRKRKAFVARAPRVAIAYESIPLMELGRDMAADALQIVSANDLREAIRSVCKGLDMPVVALMRTFGLELWLRALLVRGVCDLPGSLETVPLASAART